MRVRRLVLFGGLAIFVLIALSLSLRSIVSGPAKATTVGAMEVDCDASTAGIDTDCTYGSGATFQIAVKGTSPDAGYAGYQAKVRWADATLDYLPVPPADADVNTNSENAWPDCAIPARSNNQPGDPSVVFGCSSFPPVASSFTGSLVQFQMTCQAGGTTDLTLVPHSEDPLGTAFFTALGTAIEASPTNAQVTCGEPDTPTPSNTPSPTATTSAVPSTTQTSTLSPTASVTSTPSLTRTPTSTRTPTQTSTPCSPACPTNTVTPTFTVTLTPKTTAPVTPSPTDTSTTTPGTPGATSESTSTPTATPTLIATLTVSPTPTDSPTPTLPIATPTRTSTPTRTRTATPTRTPTPRGRLGDADKDGRIRSIDAQLILQFSAGLVPSINRTADVNGDGRTNSIDARLVLRYVAGLITVFPHT